MQISTVFFGRIGNIAWWMSFKRQHKYFQWRLKICSLTRSVKTFWPMLPSMIQTRLRVWSESSSSAWRNGASLAIQMCPVKILIRLRKCAVWLESSLSTRIRSYIFWRHNCTCHYCISEEDLHSSLNETYISLPEGIIIRLDFDITKHRKYHKNRHNHKMRPSQGTKRRGKLTLSSHWVNSADDKLMFFHEYGLTFHAKPRHE